MNFCSPRVSKEFCEEMACFRRKAKRMSKAKLLFLDETYLRIGESNHHSLRIPGEKSYVVVEDTSMYAARYDMIACCSAERVLPPIIFSPEDRKERGVQGVRSEMVIQYIDSVLAQAVGALDQYPILLVCDQSTAHNAANMLQAFHDRGCQDVVDVVFMPAQGAKRLSPLDNGIFGWWKEQCRAHTSITSRNIIHVMSSAWNRITSRQLMSCYEHCALTHERDEYFDCPSPLSHCHGNNQ